MLIHFQASYIVPLLKHEILQYINPKFGEVHCAIMQAMSYIDFTNNVFWWGGFIKLENDYNNIENKLN